MFYSSIHLFKINIRSLNWPCAVIEYLSYLSWFYNIQKYVSGILPFLISNVWYKLFHCPIILLSLGIHSSWGKVKVWAKELCCFIAFTFIEKIFYNRMSWVMRVDLNFHRTEPKPVWIRIGVKATKVSSFSWRLKYYCVNLDHSKLINTNCML